MNTIGTIPTTPGRSVSPRVDHDRPDSSSFRDVFADQKQRDRIDYNNGPYLDRAGRDAEPTTHDGVATNDASHEAPTRGDASTTSLESNDRARPDSATSNADASDTGASAEDAASAVTDEAEPVGTSPATTHEAAMTAETAAELLAALPTGQQAALAESKERVENLATPDVMAATDPEADPIVPTSADTVGSTAEEAPAPVSPDVAPPSGVIDAEGSGFERSTAQLSTQLGDNGAAADAAADTGSMSTNDPAPAAMPTEEVRAATTAAPSSSQNAPVGTAVATDGDVAPAAESTPVDAESVATTPGVLATDAAADTDADRTGRAAVSAAGQVAADGATAAATTTDAAAELIDDAGPLPTTMTKPGAASAASAAAPVASGADAPDVTGAERSGEVAGPNNPTPTTDQSRANGAAARLAEHVAMRDLVERVDRHRLATTGKLEFEIQSERFGAVRVEAVDGGEGVELSLRGDGSARQDLSDLAEQLRQEFDRDGERSAAIRIDGGELADAGLISRDQQRHTRQGSGAVASGRGVDLRM